MFANFRSFERITGSVGTEFIITVFIVSESFLWTKNGQYSICNEYVITVIIVPPIDPFPNVNI